MVDRLNWVGGVTHRNESVLFDPNPGILQKKNSKKKKEGVTDNFMARLIAGAHSLFASPTLRG